MPGPVAAAWKATGAVLTNVALGVVVFGIFWLLARLIRNVVSRALARRAMHAEMSLLISRSVYVGVISIGAAMFIAVALGSALVGVTGVLVAAGVTSLGLQDLVKNYLSGFYVLMEKNVRVGDLVESGGYQGVVTDVRMRVTYRAGGGGR